MGREVDDRVVAMSFENTKFETGVTTSLQSLQKLNDSLAKVGSTNGLENIEKSANKVTLQQPASAIDKLKAKLGFGREAAQGFGEIDQAANKVQLTGASGALDKLQQKLGDVGSGADRGFASIEQSAGRVTLSGLGSALDGVTAKFSILQGAATVALGNITSQAIMKGTNFAKGFGFGPILDGLHEYETNLKSIQTIQANTDRPLTEINKSLTELNHYSDQTIYNFSEMAKNIGTFTAAGVDLKTATSSIKGIANMAALSGSSSQQAATAMYQLSQAISSGRVGLQDWNSVVNAGMGGKKLQTALATTAIAMGDIGESAVKLEGPMKKLTINGSSFRESIMAKPGSTSWLSSEILVNTLATLDGRFSRAALSAELTKDGLRKYSKAQVEAKIATARTALEQKNGVKYTDEQFKSLMKLSDSAFKSATEVKTLGQVFDVAKETIGSGWSASFQSIFGNLKEAKSTFTDLSGTINGFINANALARNTVLHDWKALGGRTSLIEGIKNIFIALGAVIKPINKAFRDIFPRQTGYDLFYLTERFKLFTAALKIGPETAKDLRHTFKGVFALFDIGKQILGGILGVVTDLFSRIGKGSGGVLDFSGSVGDLVVELDDWLKRGDRLENFFDDLSDSIAVPLDLIGKLGDTLGNLFSGGKDQGLGDTLSSMGDQLKPSEKVIRSLSSAWEHFLDLLSGIGDALDSVIDKIGDAFGGVGDRIADAFKNADYEQVFRIIQVSLIGGIFLTLKKGLGTGGILGKLNFAHVTESLSGSLDILNRSLTAIQTNIQARTMGAIAVAIAILAAAVVALSLVNPEALARALTATAVGLGQLMGAMAIISHGVGGGMNPKAMAAGAVRLATIAGSLILVAVAVDTLAIAVMMLSRLDLDEIGRGLAGVAGLLAMVSVASGPLSKSGPRMLIAAAAIIPLAIGLSILGGAMKIFATMKWEDIAKGLVAITLALDSISVVMRTMPLNLPVTAAGLVLVGVGLAEIAGAVLAFGSMDVATLAKGIFALSFSLAEIGAALSLMPPTVLLSAAALAIVAPALVVMAGAIALMGKQSVGTLAKGIIAIGAALVVLAAGLTLMLISLPGAAALLVAASALAVLVPVIGILGSMEFGTIAKGIGAIVLVLLALGVAGTIAAPGLIILGGAIAVLGAGLLAVGSGVYLMGKGLSLLGSAGTKSVGIFVAALTAFIAVLPKIIVDFIRGLVDIVKSIAEIAPKVVDAVVKIANSIVDVIIKIAPKVAIAAGAIILALVKILNENSGPLIDAGFKLLVNFLSGIEKNIGKITHQVGNIIVNFLKAMGDNWPKIIKAGFDLLVKFLSGIANNMRRAVNKGGDIVIAIIRGISDNLQKVVTAGGRLIVRFIKSIGDQATDIVEAGAQVIVKFVRGLGQNASDIVEAGTKAAGKFIRAVGRAMLNLVDEAGQAILNFLRGLRQAVDKYAPQITEEAIGIGVAMAHGILKGLKDAIFGGGLGGVIDDMEKKIRGMIKAKSPSLVYADIGKDMGDGMILGWNQSGPRANAAGVAVASGMLNAVASAAKNAPNIMAPLGRYVGGEFARGLLGEREDISDAFADLNDKLKDQMSSSRDIIKSESAKLKDLLKEDHHDNAAIRKSREAIALNQKLLDRSSTAHRFLIKSLKDEKSELMGLAKQFAETSAKLAEAEDILKEAQKTRDDFLKSTADEFGKLPSVDAETADPLGKYLKSLTDQTAAVAAYKSTLDQLRALGLDDKTYQKLLADGTADQKFADQLLAGGKTAVDNLNALDAGLANAATGLATTAADNLYKGGVDAAQKVVDGFKAALTGKGGLAEQMEKLADEIVKAIKKKLKIKSPSQVFRDEVGKQIVLGLAQGIDANASTVTTSLDNMVGDLTSTLEAVPNILDGLADMEPTITPVLDLTSVEKSASKLSDLTNVTPINAAVSYDSASAISASQTPDEPSDDISEGAKVFKFEQNNFSPEALSEAEIYRRTHNQLSMARDALGV